MADDLHPGAHGHPVRDPSRVVPKWRIVRRWGDLGEFLEISDTVVPPHDPEKSRGTFDKPVPAEAPPDLKPLNSMLHLMVRRRWRDVPVQAGTDGSRA